MISFIMPAKNAAEFIHEALDSLQLGNEYEWELIVVNDHSTDTTYEIVKRYCALDSRISIYNNINVGKVNGLNFGYSLSKGDLIKCIDADDVLLPEFFDQLKSAHGYQVHCHDSYIVDQNLKKLGAYFVNPAFLNSSYDVVLSNLISLPRWTWSFTREVGDRIFPLPADLPFEDVWFAIVIKSYGGNIKYLKSKLYLYRQHENQTFGGILNYKKEVINFRAQRMIKLISALASNADRIALHDKSKLDYIERYNLLMVDQFQIRKILQSHLRIIHILKIILICFFPKIASLITKIKWRLDQILTMRW